MVIPFSLSWHTLSYHKVRSLFQNEFSTYCDPLRPLSISLRSTSVCLHILHPSFPYISFIIADKYVSLTVIFLSYFFFSWLEKVVHTCMYHYILHIFGKQIEYILELDYQVNRHQNLLLNLPFRSESHCSSISFNCVSSVFSKSESFASVNLANFISWTLKLWNRF